MERKPHTLSPESGLGQRGDVGSSTRGRHDLLGCASGNVVICLRSCRKGGAWGEVAGRATSNGQDCRAPPAPEGP